MEMSSSKGKPVSVSGGSMFCLSMTWKEEGNHNIVRGRCGCSWDLRFQVEGHFH